MSQSFRDRIRPWQCDTCGAKNLSANKTECPKCPAPRVGSAAAAAQDMSGQTTRTYKGEKAMLEGIAMMARQGWQVVSQSSFQPRAGVGRTLALGVVGAALIKPPMKFVVTFARVDAR